VWDGQGEALDFSLEESSSADFSESEVVYSGRNTTWSVPVGYKPGTYYYRIQAISDGGPGPWSKPQIVEMLLPPPPTPHLAAANYLTGGERGSFELRWQPVPGATRYELEETNQDANEHRLIPVEETIWHVTEQSVGHYVYRVRACHESGCSEWSNEQTIAIASQAPQAAPIVDASNADSMGVVHLRWEPVELAMEYVVEVSDSENFRNARVHTTGSQEIEISRRDPGLIYIRVSATNDGGNGPWSDPIKITVVPGAPAWIETNTDPDGRITITWGAVGGHVSYHVQIADMGQDFRDVYHGKETQTVLTSHKKPQLFRVRTEASELASDWTLSEPSFATGHIDIPKLNPASIDSNGGVQLSWGQANTATHYLLEVSHDDRFVNMRSHKLDRNEVTFNPPISGTYWFRVRACHGDTKSDPSNIVSVEIQRPTTPHLWPVDPVTSGALFDVVWSGVPGSAYYELQMGGDDTFAKAPIATRKIFHPSQKMTINDLKMGRYYFRVRAFDSNGEVSMWSNMITVDVR
jgi:hypothetical protein